MRRHCENCTSNANVKTCACDCHRDRFAAFRQKYPLLCVGMPENVLASLAYLERISPWRTPNYGDSVLNRCPMCGASPCQHSKLKTHKEAEVVLGRFNLFQ